MTYRNTLFMMLTCVLLQTQMYGSGYTVGYRIGAEKAILNYTKDQKITIPICAFNALVDQLAEKFKNSELFSEEHHRQLTEKLIDGYLQRPTLAKASTKESPIFIPGVPIFVSRSNSSTESAEMPHTQLTMIATPVISVTPPFPIIPPAYALGTQSDPNLPPLTGEYVGNFDFTESSDPAAHAHRRSPSPKEAVNPLTLNFISKSIISDKSLPIITTQQPSTSDIEFSIPRGWSPEHSTSEDRRSSVVAPDRTITPQDSCCARFIGLICSCWTKEKYAPTA